MTCDTWEWTPAWEWTYVEDIFTKDHWLTQLTEVFVEEPGSK